MLKLLTFIIECLITLSLHLCQKSSLLHSSFLYRLPNIELLIYYFLYHARTFMLFLLSRISIISDFLVDLFNLIFQTAQFSCRPRSWVLSYMSKILLALGFWKADLHLLLIVVLSTYFVHMHLHIHTFNCVSSYKIYFLVYHLFIFTFVELMLSLL